MAFFVRIEVKKHKIIATDNPSDTLTGVLKRGGPAFLIPFVLLVALLVTGFTPVYAAGIAIAATIAASWLTPKPMGPRAVIESLILGAKNMTMTAILLISIGLMVNVIAMTGIGNIFSLMIAEWAGNSLIIALVLIALASLVLGMGLPVTTAYIVLATLSAPALQGLIQNNFLIDMLMSGQVPETARATWGLVSSAATTALTGPISRDAAEALIAATPHDALVLIYPMALNPALVTAALLSAHMIIFWLSQDSNVTPPVCLAAGQGAVSNAGAVCLFQVSSRHTNRDGRHLRRRSDRRLWDRSCHRGSYGRAAQSAAQADRRGRGARRYLAEPARRERHSRCRRADHYQLQHLHRAAPKN